MYEIIAQAEGISLTPIIVGVLTALAGSGATAWFTLARTNRKLEAEGEKIYQDALKVAEERAETSYRVMSGIATTLEARLQATDQALVAANAKVEAAEAKIRELHTRAELAERDRDRAIQNAELERDALKARIADLEERYTDLIARLPGRRRRDQSGRFLDAHGETVEDDIAEDARMVEEDQSNLDEEDQENPPTSS